MIFIYAMLIGGMICGFTQLLSELKVPFPVTVLSLIILGGGLGTKLGFIDFFNRLGPGGASVTALGCGNGAYNAAMALIQNQTALPLILGASLNIVLVAVGAACGKKLLEKFPEQIPDINSKQS